MSSRFRGRSPSLDRIVSYDKDGVRLVRPKHSHEPSASQVVNNIEYKNALLERLDQAKQFCADLWEKINMNGTYYGKERLLNSMNVHLASMYFYINRTIIPVNFQHDKTIAGYLRLISQEVNLLTNAALSEEFLADGILNLSTNECKEQLKNIDYYIESN
jgi:hypothetical protein